MVPRDLIAPIETGPDGSRLATCPVCATAAMIPPAAGGWVQLRCGSCGTQFRATDGTSSPPVTIEDLHRNLMQWIESGEPDRWVEGHAGTWGEAEFGRLVETLTASAFWPLDLGGVRHALAEAVGRYRAARAKPPAPRSRKRLFVHWRGKIPELAEGQWYPCPVCRRVEIQIFDGEEETNRITCPLCRTSFDVKAVRAPLPPFAPITSPGPTDRLLPQGWFSGVIWGLLIGFLVIVTIGGLWMFGKLLRWWFGD